MFPPVFSQPAPAPYSRRIKNITYPINHKFSQAQCGNAALRGIDNPPFFQYNYKSVILTIKIRYVRVAGTGACVTRRDFPQIHFYDQDFVDIYDKTQVWVSDCLKDVAGSEEKLYVTPESGVVDQNTAIFSSFFLVYSNKIYPTNTTLDYFYAKQEENGAIRSMYRAENGSRVFEDDNPEGVGLPLFAWAEFNHYHKTANKKRIREIIPVIDKYNNWLDAVFRRENGLYDAPMTATGWHHSPRGAARYLIDFNTAMAVNAVYMSALADLLNDKDMSIRYKQKYFSLKTRINGLMWDAGTGFYYDIDENEKRVMVKTLAGYWPLLAELPNADKAERIIQKLTAPGCFGADHPFPSVALDEPAFNADGCGYSGSVFPHLTFMVIKGLERYQRYELARECAIRHLYFTLDSMNPEGDHHKGFLWEAYLPTREGPALPPADLSGSSVLFPRKQYLAYAALSTISLMIENVVGFSISLPRKTVDWIVPNMEIMGIENMSLKKNMITILANKAGRGWEIHMESEKLYYFTINVLGRKKKTLPIPSGKCSMLVDKI
jgi:neutral trehalase